jgi:hypothetical protein
MAGKAVISLTTGLEDSEKVTVAFLVAVGAAESNRPTLMFLTKEAVRLAVDGTAVGVAAGAALRLPIWRSGTRRRRQILRVPDLFQRQAPGSRIPHRRGGTSRHHPHVGVDRRRRSHTFSY